MGLCVMKVDWKKYEEKISNFFTKHIIKIAIVAVVVVLSFYFFSFHYQLSDDNGDWGTFGDFFGGTLNPILSFLALVIVLKTYLSQQEELKETRKILEEQSETQKRQQFENTFFELLKVHNQELENLLKFRQFTTPNGEEVNIFTILMEVVFCKDDEEMSLNTAQIIVSDKIELRIGMGLWGNYLRVLYQLLKFIAIKSLDSEIDSEFKVDEIEKTKVGINEKMYSNIVRALLPDEIMKLLSVYCYTEVEDKKNYHKYKALIERYAFFEHASFNQTNDKHQIFQDYPLLLKVRNFYTPKAFGK